MRYRKQAFLVTAVLAVGLVARSAALAEYATIRGTPIAQGQMRVAQADFEHIQQVQPKANDQFVLKETRVEGEISGVLARVRVEQVFENPYSERLEAVYVFPLPENAAVDRYWFQIGEKVVRGVVKKREEARREYEHAKSQGRKAALLEQERPDIFTQSVANIPSHGTITVHLEYVYPVVIDSGRYVFRFPMVVGPRYIPGQSLARPNVGRGWISDTDQVPDASRVTPEPLPQGMRNGNDVKISLKLDAGMPIQAMTGVTHELDIEKDGETKAVIQLKNQTAIPDKDFLFEYRLAGEDTVLASLAHRDQSGGYFALVLQPKWNIETRELAPREVILLLDTSGSTHGPAISQLRIFAQHVLEKLNSQDTFRIVAFSSTARAMRSEALPATSTNIEAGKQFIRGLNSGGGTEMLPALQTALASSSVAEQNRVRYLVLITDAMVGNDDTILGYLNQPQFHDVRVFPVAVGAAPNHYLISRAAELGRGFSMQVTNQDNAAEMAKRFNEKMSAPYMTDLEIDWGTLKPVDVVPEILPDLYSGRPLVVMGRYDQPGKAEIMLKANIQGQAIKSGLTLTLPEETKEHDSLAPLWAQQRIRQIWNRNVGRETRQSRDEITQIGLTHQLVTRYTSFVAVEMDAKDLAKGDLRTQFVQPMMPEGIPDAAIGIDRRAQGSAQATARRQATTPVHSSPAAAPASPQPSSASQGYDRDSSSHSGGGGGGGGSVEWLFLASFAALAGGRWLSTHRKHNAA
ncbi:MAG: VWA domain-containing protein [Pirellulales bacterium]|nr:VWA domain-containing protein [Pirellulales bacterium]